MSGFYNRQPAYTRNLTPTDAVKDVLTSAIQPLSIWLNDRISFTDIVNDLIHSMYIHNYTLVVINQYSIIMFFAFLSIPESRITFALLRLQHC